MKKFVSILLVAFLLVSMLAIGVFAEGETETETTAETETPVAPEWKTFWVTHFDNNTVEGSGVIFTETYDGAVWWLHIALKPVADKTGVYEVVETSDGTPDGHGTALAIPEGGFVYATNYGNDYSADGGIDYTNAGVQAVTGAFKSLKTGDKITIKGVDIANKTVPTTTSDKNWYDDDYVCTAEYALGEVEIKDDEKEPEKVKEVITVDGKLDDNGWAEDGWVKAVPGTNAGWQGSEPESEDKISFDYQLRADDDNLYIGVRTNFELAKAPEGKVGNGEGTNLRIWIKTNSEATTYTHFYDSFINNDGTQGSQSKYNTSTTANSQDFIENSKMTTVMATDSDNHVVAEMTIPLTEINAGESFLMYVTVSNKPADGANQCLFAPALGVVDDVQKHIASNWTEANNNVGLTVKPADIALGEIEVGDDEPKTPTEPKYEDTIKELNGEKNDPAEFELDITTTGDYKAGSTVKVTVTLKNVTHGEGISILSFDLGYDKDSLEFTNYEFEKLNVYNEETKQREEVQGALILDTTGSRLTEDNGKWESVSGFDEENPGVIHVSYATEKDAEEFMAKNDGDIVLNFEFKVKENAGKEAGLWIANETVTATDWIMNGDEHTFAGNGNYAILTAEEADKPGDDTTTEPTPGDSTVSVVVLAIIALVAVAGSAVVIKKRG